MPRRLQILRATSSVAVAVTASVVGCPSASSTCGICAYALRPPSPAWCASSITRNETLPPAAKRSRWIARNSGVVSTTSTSPAASASNVRARSSSPVSPVSTRTVMPSFPNESDRWYAWSATSARSGYTNTLARRCSIASRAAWMWKMSDLPRPVAMMASVDVPRPSCSMASLWASSSSCSPIMVRLSSSVSSEPESVSR